MAFIVSNIIFLSISSMHAFWLEMMQCPMAAFIWTCNELSASLFISALSSHFTLHSRLLQHISRHGQSHLFHRIPPHGYLKLSGAPNFSRSAVPIDLFRSHSWKSSDHYCHCNRPTSLLSNVFLYKQLIPHRPFLHLC